MFEKVEILIPQIVGFCITSRTKRLSVYKLNLFSSPSFSDLISHSSLILSSLSDKLELNHSLSFESTGALKSIRSGKFVNEVTLPLMRVENLIIML